MSGEPQQQKQREEGAEERQGSNVGHPDLSQISMNKHDLQFNDLFSTNRPQNVLAGASSGLKSLAKGTVCGMASLAVLPAVGYKQEGVQGAAKGLAAGILGCVGFVGTGVAVGVGQTLRGVYYTPEAMREGISGKKRWDKNTRKWVVDDLERERVLLRDGETVEEIIKRGRERFEQQEKDESQHRAEKTVACREYYNVLGVEPHATDNQIKRAYYTKASKCHPDKNKAPEAKQQFQELSEAYHVLADPSSRAKYDAEGKDAVKQGENQLSPDVMYSTLFGSEVFEPYIGKLSFSLYFMSDVVLTREETETIQRMRELRVAIKLSSLLRPYVDGNKEEFLDAARALAASLATASFGDRLLEVIGHEYQLNARHGLSLWDSHVAKIQGTRDNFASYGRMVNSGYNAYTSYRKAAEAPEENSQVAAGRVEEAVTSSLIDVAFEATYLDVAKTLANSIAKLLHDDVTHEVIVARAEGLIELGKTFVEAAQAAREASTQTNMERLRSAFMPV